MHRPRPFFHFEDLLDVSNTGDVASKTLVLLRQNEGLCEIIKNRLKMTSRNNKKRGVDAAKKTGVCVLFSLPGTAKIELPCGRGNNL